MGQQPTTAARSIWKRWPEMPNLIPSPRADLSQRPSGLDRRTGRALADLERQTLLSLASVQAAGLVQTAKIHEIDSLTREAMSGQALLARWRDTLAAGDPFLGDELRFFTDVARMGKGEIIADTISSYCRGDGR